MITILVVENASAVASGATKTSRVSSTKKAVSALAGITKATGPWANLTGVNGDTELNGQGDRKSTRLNSSHLGISDAAFCLEKKGDSAAIHGRGPPCQPVRSADPDRPRS